ncbi:hypothetical protein GE061_019530 [Apolygus lucorum]|uniref:Uncharacterized protein n=1 Tax=Apolygus lucorum TaxID=248454 RepID=A0A6A4JMH9_APOLU|nr:hypothetical protein GE061_019530 [Apolygus lucorum]
MDSRRLPRTCFERLVELVPHCSDYRYNWVLQLESLFEMAICGSCLELPTGSQKELRTTFLQNIERTSWEKDVQSAGVSRFNSFPRNSNALNGECAEHLNLDLPLYIKRTLAQIRTIGNRVGRITIDHLTSAFSDAQPCQVFNPGIPDTVCHLIEECAVFRAERRRVLGQAVLACGPWRNPPNYLVFREASTVCACVP